MGNTLQNGRYKAEHNNGIFDQYKIVIDVRENSKSYILNLIEYDSCYSPAQIDMLFSKSKKVIINKERSPHAMRIWSDDNFTIYPYQAGIPFYFKLMN